MSFLLCPAGRSPRRTGGNCGFGSPCPSCNGAKTVRWTVFRAWAFAVFAVGREREANCAQLAFFPAPSPTKQKDICGCPFCFVRRDEVPGGPGGNCGFGSPCPCTFASYRRGRDLAKPTSTRRPAMYDPGFLHGRGDPSPTGAAPSTPRHVRSRFSPREDRESATTDEFPPPSLLISPVRDIMIKKCNARVL